MVIGTSMGGMQAMEILLRALPADFPLPVVLVQHRSADSGDHEHECPDHGRRDVESSTRPARGSTTPGGSLRLAHVQPPPVCRRFHAGIPLGFDRQPDNDRGPPQPRWSEPIRVGLPTRLMDWISPWI